MVAPTAIAIFMMHNIAGRETVLAKILISLKHRLPHTIEVALFTHFLSLRLLLLYVVLILLPSNFLYILRVVVVLLQIAICAKTFSHVTVRRTFTSMAHIYSFTPRFHGYIISLS